MHSRAQSILGDGVATPKSVPQDVDEELPRNSLIPLTGAHGELALDPYTLPQVPNLLIYQGDATNQTHTKFYQRQIVDTQTQLQQTRQERDTHYADAITLRGQLDQYKPAYEQNFRKVTALETDNALSKQKLGTAKAENRDLRGQLDQYKTGYEQYYRTASTLQAETARLKQELESTKSENRSLKHQLKTANDTATYYHDQFRQRGTQDEATGGTGGNSDASQAELNLARERIRSLEAQVVLLEKLAQERGERADELKAWLSEANGTLNGKGKGGIDFET